MKSQQFCPKVFSFGPVFIGLILLSSTDVEAQLAAWDFTGESSVETSVAEVYGPNLDASNLLTRGSGASASAGSNSFRTVGFQNNGIATTNMDHFQFTLSASPGFVLNLSSIDAYMAGTGTFSANPGTTNQFAYSLDGINYTLIGSPLMRVGNGALPQTDLSAIPALQNVPNTITVTFRFYASGQTSTGGWGFNSPSNPSSGLSVGGTISPVGPACGITLGSITAICNTVNPGNVDTYDLTIPYTGSQAGLIVTNGSGSGTLSGDPATPNSSFVVSGISEVDNYVVTFGSPCAALNVSGNAPDCDPPPSTTIVINEVDSDTPGTDVLEFIELFGLTNEALDGMVVVLFNGSNDQSYASYDLDGYSLDANGFFVLGNLTVSNVDLVIANGTIQNGQDAVALYFGNGIDFPNGTSVTTSNLIDALVYDTSDPDDAGLLVLLNPGQPQVNENENGNSADVSNSRVPDGGTQRNTDSYVAQLPTPGTTNVPACGITLGTPVTECVDGNTYRVSISYAGVQAGVTVINNSGSGSVDLVNGDDPATDLSGTIIVTGISDLNAYDVSLSAPCGSQMVSGAAPPCEPPPTLVINEVDYNNPGTDDDEWLELFNYGPDPVQLAGVQIELVNGTGGGAAIYETIVLPSFSLASGGYYVVGNNALNPDVDFVFTGSIQNGAPDAIGLRAADNILLDAVSYEGTSGAPYTEGTGFSGADSGSDPGEVIARAPNGADSDDNDSDWSVWCATPGASNNGVIDDDGDGIPNCVDPCPLALDGILNLDPITCNCEAGYFQTTTTIGPNTVITDCTICPPGFFCPDGVGSFPCDPGYFNGNEGVVACEACPAGTFNPSVAQVSCQACPSGETSAPGSISCAPCVDVTLEINTDANDAETTWEIQDAGTFAVYCSGGNYTIGAPANQLETCCLPQTGQYTLVVNDSGGDGILSGGYRLRTAAPDNRRIIDNYNNGDFGSLSQITGNAYSFSLPVGDDRLIYTSCDKYWWKSGEYIVANANPDVSAEWIPNGPSSAQDADTGYEFWFTDPNGGYSFRKFRPHNQSDNFGPANEYRACHLKINNWSAAMHIPEGELMNVKVRGRVNGVNNPWGPACRFVRDEVLALCPPTKLMDIPGNQFLSCNQTRQFVNNQRIHARPVSGGNQYEWRFKYIDDDSEIFRTSGPYFLNLGWNANQAPPLVEGQYWVWVRARRNIPGEGQTWCMWGDSCLLTITPSFAGGGTNLELIGTSSEGPASLQLWPNPNAGDQVWMRIEHLPQDVATITVDLYDLRGQRVAARTLATQDGLINTVVDLNGELASGLYLVSITAGEQHWTERLVIAP